jgi:tyrosyl-DNA phosphodiesterase-1
VLVAQYEPRARALGFEAQSDSSPEKGKKRKADEMEGKESVGGWVYVGSHNFSSAAWVSFQ